VSTCQKVVWYPERKSRGGSQIVVVCLTGMLENGFVSLSTKAAAGRGAVAETDSLGKTN
jgi:hypothetical protein